MSPAHPVGYDEQPPPASLAPWVECLWWKRAERDAAAEPARILPDGRIDLIWTTGAGVLVAGPQTRFLTTPFAAPFLAVGARFHPGAGSTVLGLPAHELLDAHVPCGAVDARLERMVERRLATARTPAEAVTAFGDLLTEHCRALDPPDPLVRAAVAALGGRRVRVAELARRGAISERQLQRRFRVGVGYGPKTLARVLRFRRFTHRLADGGDDLAGLAAWAGYADQAHLTRESRALSGLTPAQLPGARRAA